MKKSTLLIGAAVVALGFASCKKEYTCECTVESTVMGTTTTSTSTYTINETKANARTACDAGDGEATSLGVTFTSECKIK